MGGEIFKNTHEHKDTFKTGDISKEYRKQTEAPTEMYSRRLMLESLEQSDKKKTVKDDHSIKTIKVPAELILEHGVDYELERPKFKKHIGFSRMYTEIEEKDSSRMKLIRTTMGRYFDYKEMLKDDKLDADDRQWILEQCMETLKKISAACDKYKSHRFFYAGRKRGKERKKDVDQLKKKALEELEQAKVKYVRFMDRKKKPDTAERKPVTKNDVIKLEAAGGTGGLLDLSKLDMMEDADRDMYAQKHHMAIRSELDIKNTDLTAEEKELLKKINEYSNIRITASNVQHMGYSTYFGENAGRKKLAREAVLMKEIAKQLDEMEKSGKLTGKKEEIFGLYRKNFCGLKNGALKIPEKLESYQIEDYSKNAAYHDSTMTKKEVIDEKGDKNINAEFKERKIKIKDRSADPLFPHEPCVSDIVQDGMGNCFLLAAIAELVAKDKDAITNMMYDDGKIVTVRLYEKRGSGNTVSMSPRYVKVDKKVCEETARDALWVQILCKAYAAFVKDYQVNEKHTNAVKVLRDHYLGYDEENVIDYSFISNGGLTHEVFPALTGEVPREFEKVLGSVDEVDSDNDLIKIVHEAGVSETKQQEMEKSGAIFDKEFAYLEQQKNRYGHDEELKMVYTKTAYADGFKKLDKRLEGFFADYRNTIGKRKELETPMMEAIKNNAERYLIFLGRNSGFSNQDSYNAHRYALRYLKGDKSLNDKELSIAKTLVEGLKKDYKEKVETGSFNKGVNALPAEYTEISADEAVKKLKEYYKVLGAEEEYEELYRQSLEMKYDDPIPGEFTEEDKKPAAAKARVVLCKMTTRCINCIEEKLLKDAEDELQDNDKIAEKYKIVNKAAEKFTYEDYKALNKGMSNSKALEELAKYMDSSPEEAFEHVKKAMLEKYKLYFKIKDEADDGDFTKMFTGVYPATTLKLYARIKDGLSKGKTLAAGSREGWGKKNARGESEDKGTVGKHAYSVLGVKDVIFRGKKIHMIKVRNPWGRYSLQYNWNNITKEMEFDTKRADDSGIFYIELTHFTRVFQSLFDAGDKKISKY